MKTHISEDRTKLTITVDAQERAAIHEMEDEKNIHTDWALADFLEPITCNSELDWVNPAETGDLTDAPMLGIRANVKSDPAYEPILERWAWMEYQVRSLMEELRDKGEAVLIGGPLN